MAMSGSAETRDRNRQISRRSGSETLFEAALLIGGKDVAASGDATFERASPVTGDLVTTASAASLDDVDMACNAAAAAFPDWSRTSPSHRRAILERAAALLLERRDDFAARMMAETGATATWCGFNVELSAKILSEAAAMSRSAARSSRRI